MTVTWDKILILKKKHNPPKKHLFGKCLQRELILLHLLFHWWMFALNMVKVSNIEVSNLVSWKLRLRTALNSVSGRSFCPWLCMMSLRGNIPSMTVSGATLLFTRCSQTKETGSWVVETFPASELAFHQKSFHFPAY